MNKTSTTKQPSIERVSRYPGGTTRAYTDAAQPQPTAPKGIEILMFRHHQIVVLRSQSPETESSAC
jgi:hypothetical protein